MKTKKTPVSKKNSMAQRDQSQSKGNTIKRSTAKKKATKSKTKVWDIYRDLFTMRMKPVPEAFIDKLAEDLIKWVTEETGKPKSRRILIRTFFREKGIGTRSYYKWLKRHPILAEAHEEALYILGETREIGAALRDYDANIIRIRQHAYDPEWKKDEEWRNTLKQQADAKTQQETIMWTMQQFPNSDLVPSKKTKSSPASSQDKKEANER